MIALCNYITDIATISSFKLYESPFLRHLVFHANWKSKRKNNYRWICRSQSVSAHCRTLPEKASPQRNVFLKNRIHSARQHAWILSLSGGKSCAKNVPTSRQCGKQQQQPEEQRKPIWFDKNRKQSVNHTSGSNRMKNIRKPKGEPEEDYGRGLWRWIRIKYPLHVKKVDVFGSRATPTK